MPALLVVLFILVPLAEILVILQVGGVIGGWWTAALLVADSLLGAWLLRVEGRRAWSQFRTALQEGRWPGDEVAQGALVIVGGTLLLTPGFLTDGLGFLFLVAPTRRWVARRLRARVGEQMAPGSGAAPGPRVGGRGSSAAQGPAGDGGDTTGRTGAGGAHGTGSGQGSGSGAGRGPRAGPGPRRRDGEPVQLDVEVVEIRREQGSRSVSGGGPDDPRADGDPPEDDPRDTGGTPGAPRDDHGGR